MCKSGLMFWAMPAMPFIVMARMAREWSAWTCGSKAMRHDGRCWDWERLAREWSCAEPERRPRRKNVVETVRASGSFETLLKALKRTELDAALAGEGPFTVFAPSDEAFEKLPRKRLQGLLDNPEELARVLKHHVVSGRLMSSDLEGVVSLRTLEDDTLTVHTTLGVKIGKAHVIKADILCENGVIHAIDSVLLPE